MIDGAGDNRSRSLLVRFVGSLLSVLATLFLGGCGGGNSNSSTLPTAAMAEAEPPWFADVTDQSGLRFVDDAGPTDGEYFLPQINGSGAALLDFDNDGRLDIYLLQGAGKESAFTCSLFHQRSHGTFEDVSHGSGLDINGTNTGAAAADANNDGLVDVLVAQYLGVKLFLNQGDGKFKDATDQAGLSNPYWGTSASFLDYDRDGWLDLVVVNYVAFEESRHCVLGGGRDFCRPNVFEGTPSRLYRNRGVDEHGTWQGYEDRTEAAGLQAFLGAGMGVICTDFTGDLWPDIFVANDMQANCLWVNQQNGTFREEAVARGLAYNALGQALSNMGAAYGDVDGDGLGDLFVTLFTNERHALWRQGPRGVFVEQAAAAGLTQAAWHGTAWGTVLSDFNNDGAPDVALVNGFVDRQDVDSDDFWTPYKDRNQLFANDGTGKFRDISLDNPAFSGQPNVGRGLCVGDLNDDGALDLLVTQVAGPARILKNVAPARGHWLLVRALDPKLKRDAIGAEIVLQAGNRRWMNVVQPAQSFQCSNDPRVHFGLGSVDHIDSIEVQWPDGSREQFRCAGVDCKVELQRGTGKLLSGSAESAASPNVEAGQGDLR
jgi:hypothetical protein